MAMHLQRAGVYLQKTKYEQIYSNYSKRKIRLAMGENLERLGDKLSGEVTPVV